MKILFSSKSGHDKTESLHYRRVLQAMHHDVVWLPAANLWSNTDKAVKPELGMAVGTTLDNILYVASDPPQLFLYIEPGGIIPEGIEKAPFPTACVICDVHQDLQVRLRLARFFDHVFLYHRNYLKAFDEHPPEHVHWLPYACDLEVFKPLDVKRDLDVAFIGQNVPGSGRARILSILSRRYRINEQRYYLQEEIPAIYSRAKIVLNLPLADDLNFRTFEAMSCGAMLLTRRVANGQELLFQEGKHYVAFADEDELIAKIDYYLSHASERETIAAAGLEEVRRSHRLEQRIQQLIDTVKAFPEKAAPIRRLTPTQVDRQYAWLYEFWRQITPGLKLARKARQEGRPWVKLMVPAVRSFLRVALR